MSSSWYICIVACLNVRFLPAQYTRSSFHIRSYKDKLDNFQRNDQKECEHLLYQQAQIVNFLIKNKINSSVKGIVPVSNIIAMMWI